VPPGDLLRIDTCGSVATGLALVDRVQSAHFHTRHLLLALDAASRIGWRALAFDLALRAPRAAAHRRIAECTERAEAMAQRVGHPQCLAVCALARGITALLGGELRAAHAFANERCPSARSGPRHDVGLNSAQEFSWRRSCSRAKCARRHASRRHWPRRASAATVLRDGASHAHESRVWLAADNADERSAKLATRWTMVARGFHQQHYNQMLAAIQTELYRGRAGGVAGRPNGGLSSSDACAGAVLAHRGPPVRVARCVSGRRRQAKFLAIARGDAARIARERMAWSIHRRAPAGVRRISRRTRATPRAGCPRSPTSNVWT
jgi:hypothetical protein